MLAQPVFPCQPASGRLVQMAKPWMAAVENAGTGVVAAAGAAGGSGGETSAPPALAHGQADGGLGDRWLRRTIGATIASLLE